MFKDVRVKKKTLHLRISSIVSVLSVDKIEIDKHEVELLMGVYKGSVCLIYCAR